MITTGVWSVSYWMGVWDADALCGYVHGQLTIPFFVSPVPEAVGIMEPALEVPEPGSSPIHVAAGPPPLAATTDALVSQVEFERSRGMRWVLEVHPGVSLESLRHRLRDRLGSRCEVEPLFEPVPDDSTLERFAVVRLPGIRARDLEEGPYEWAYRLVDSVPEAFRVEPDTPFAFMPPEGEIGLESTSGGCTVPEVDVPADARWALTNARVPLAWDRVPPAGGRRFGEGILIGHPDTGWAEHRELEQGALDLVLARDFISDGPTQARDPLEAGALLHPGHGTATGSVLVSRNSFAITGVAPGATLVPIRCARSVIIVFNATDVARAIQHAVNVGCHVISISLGGPPRSSLTAAVNYAVSRNVIVAAAAGNCVEFVTAPATVDACIACAASTHLDGTWPGSCRGPAVTVSAPGQFVYCARREPGSGLTSVVSPSQGTSYAVAHVAGAAALWLAFHGRNALLARYAGGPKLQSVFKALLRQTARRPVLGWDTDNYGAGILDAHAVLGAGLPQGIEEGLESLAPTAPSPEVPLERMLGRAAARRMLADIFGTKDQARLSAAADRFGTELAERLLRERAALGRDESLELLAPAPNPRLDHCSRSLRRAAGRGLS